MNDCFFKAKNKKEAEIEILKRLGGESPFTCFLKDWIIDYGRSTPSLKKYPMYLKTQNEKPQFCLSDGETLYGFLFDITTNKMITKKYMGSADSVFMHQKEQLSEGMTVPENIVAVFITRLTNGGWLVDVVGNLTPQVKKEDPQIIEPSFLEKARLYFENSNNDCLRSSDTLNEDEAKYIFTFFRKAEDKVSDLAFELADVSNGMLKNDLPYDNENVWSCLFEKNEEIIKMTFISKNKDIKVQQLQPVRVVVLDIEAWIKTAKRKV